MGYRAKKSAEMSSIRKCYEAIRLSILESVVMSEFAYVFSTLTVGGFVSGVT